MILTNTEIQHVNNDLEIIEELGVELDLDLILEEELESGLPSDINNAW